MMRTAVVVAAGAVCAAQSCSPANFSFVNGYDLNGGDLPGQPVSQTLSTPQQCAQLCCATAGCIAFSLNAGAVNSRSCYLKAGGWSNQSIAGVDSGSLPPAKPNTNFPWFNVSLPQAERVAALVAAFTPAELISWLNDASPAIPRLGLPAYSWEGEALHGVAWNGVSTLFPENIAWGASFDAQLVADIGTAIAVEARAKWLAGLSPDGSSAEFAGLGFMTPNNNLFINPTWGRGQETYGEDPVLTSVLTYTLVNALQYGPESNQYIRMIATSKHAIGQHLDSYGTDGQYRLSHSFNYTETDIQQTYLPPFAAAVAAGVASVMCEYSGMNGTNPEWPNPDGPEPWGVPTCLHPALQKYFRDQLQWEGFVISDEGSITFAGPGYHGYTKTVQQAACLAMNAGTDLALGGEYAGTLANCLADGNVTLATLQRASTRTLTALMKLGWFDTLAARSQGFPDPVPFNDVTVDSNVSSPAHRALAGKAAREGMVLLKNANGRTLPLNPTALRKVALVGPAATYSGTATSSYIGNYAGCEDGPGGNLIGDPRCHVVTLLEALQNASTQFGFTLSYAAGSDINTLNTSGVAAAVASAEGADVIIASVGLDTCQESFCSEGEANDRGRGADSIAPTLDFPGVQSQLVRVLAAVYPTTPIILVVQSGGPVSSPIVYGEASAILQAWYPGYEAGNAIVDVLFGGYSPAGRLPVTILTDLSEMAPPTDVIMSTAPGRTHRYYTNKPLYPFGFGLSYANFSYTGMSVQPASLAPTDASFTVSAQLQHTGGMLSDEVVQVYGRFLANSTGLASYPLQQLLNFTRVHDIQPGSAPQTVSFTIPRSALTLMSPGGVMTVAPGTWQLWIGGGPPSAAQYPGGGAVLTGTLTVQ